MTTDERLDRLVERHEALTQSVESLTRDLHDMRGFISDIAQGTARLLRVVEMHENRLDGHNDRLDNLEGT
jgi:ABC-type transporter Mla subunit MlaD